MKIKSKIILGFVVVVLFAWLIALLGGININMVDGEYDELMEVIAPMKDGVHVMSETVQRVNARTFEYLLSGNAAQRNEAVIEMRNLEDGARKFLEYRENFSDREKAFGDQLLAKIKDLNVRANAVMDMKAAAVAPEEVLQASESSLRPTVNELQEQFSAQLDEFRERQEQKAEKIDTYLDTGLLLLIVISAVTLIVAVIVAFAIARSISRPIDELTHAADGISKGDINQVVRRKSKDEIGDLAEAFERMRVSLKVVMDEIRK